MITQLFRSKSCVLKQSNPFDSFPPSPSFYLSNDDEEEMEEEKSNSKPISTPLIVGSEREASFREINTRNVKQSHHHQLPMLEVLVEALRKSLVVSCTSVVGMDEINNSSSMDIGWPTDVCHLSHVTFDRFNGFLGLPVEFQPEIPTKVPSASASVFGVSASSMQCSFDERGNSVPTILLMMQKRLYSDGGLQAEGIFRITGEDNQEEYVRCQLNKGIVPCDIDVHCLAGLIKAWFRELPKGILDSLSPEQIMNCNTKEECVRVASLLQPTEFSLLDWAVNLMADVVQHEPQNKMNARNIAMVFAPNMTQMADPLTALMHAVRVMNFLKTLIVKVLREREKSSISSNNKGDPDELLRTETDNDDGSSLDPAIGVSVHRRPVLSCFLTSSSHDSLVRENEIFWSGTEHCKREEESEKISWRNGVRKLYKYTLFQNIKRSGFGIPNNRAGGGGEAAWV